MSMIFFRMKLTDIVCTLDENIYSVVTDKRSPIENVLDTTANRKCIVTFLFLQMVAVYLAYH